MIIFIFLLFNTPFASATQAQPVPIPEEPSISPQISIDGSAVGTATYTVNSQHSDGQAGINYSDSGIVIGAAQKLYDGGATGSLGIGAVTLEDGGLFLHQAFVDFQSETIEALIGRSDSPAAHLVDFPTIRGDDLVTLTNPMNPYSSGDVSEEHRYADVGSVSFNQGLTYYETIYVQHLINSAGSSGEGINSFGVIFQYLGEVGAEALETFPSLGAGYEYVASGNHRIFAGGVMNLNESITDRLDVRLQDILTVGRNTPLNSNSVAASFRFLHSPFGRPGYQLALTGGFKNFFDSDNLNSLGFAFSAAKRLGMGFDVIAQYQGLRQDNSGQFEHAIELGLVFNFNATINEHISPRRTLLNQKHEYLPRSM